jgi:Xaa-Pro aminopeptidase
MSGKLAALRRRLDKAEKVLAETAEQERLADCICKVAGKSGPTIARSDLIEEFEAEMNQKCPVHDFRNLGQILAVQIGEPSERFRLLLDEYRARKTEYERAKLEYAHEES